MGNVEAVEWPGLFREASILKHLFTADSCTMHPHHEHIKYFVHSDWRARG